LLGGSTSGCRSPAIPQRLRQQRQPVLEPWHLLHRQSPSTTPDPLAVRIRTPAPPEGRPVEHLLSRGVHAGALPGGRIARVRPVGASGHSVACPKGISPSSQPVPRSEPVSVGVDDTSLDRDHGWLRRVYHELECRPTRHVRRQIRSRGNAPRAYPRRAVRRQTRATRLRLEPRGSWCARELSPLG
jgi:hypothetical protein